MATTDGKTKLIVDLPMELKKEFKMYCTMNDVAMTEVVEQMVIEYLNQKGWRPASTKEKELG